MALIGPRRTDFFDCSVTLIQWNGGLMEARAGDQAPPERRSWAMLTRQ